MSVSVPASISVNETRRSVQLCATLSGNIEEEVAIILRSGDGTGSNRIMSKMKQFVS